MKNFAIIVISGIFLSFSAYSQTVTSFTVDDFDYSGDTTEIDNDDDLESVLITIDEAINLVGNAGNGHLIDFENSTDSYVGTFTLTVEENVSYADTNQAEDSGTILNLERFGNPTADALSLVVNNNAELSSELGVANTSLIYVNAKDGGFFSTTINNNGTMNADLESAEDTRAINIIMDENDSSIVTVNNTGIINSEGSAISVQYGGDHVITNSGTIDNSDAVGGGSQNHAIVFDGSESLTINNSGTIETDDGYNAIMVQNDVASFTLNLLDGSDITGDIVSSADNNVLGIQDSYNIDELVSATGLISGDNGWDEVIIRADDGILTIANNESIELSSNLVITDSDSNETTVTGASFKNDGVINNNGTFTVGSNATFVNNGTMTGDLTVGSGATFSGSGTSGDVTIQSGGILSPGNSIGTNNVSSLTLNNGSISNFEYGNSSADKLIASGNIALDGTLNITADSTFNSGQKFVLSQNLFETTSGNLSGTFDDVNLTLGNDYLYDFGYSDQSASLTIVNKLNNNILDSRLFLANNVLRITNRQNHNEFVRHFRNRNKNYYDSNRYHSWINFENLDYDRDSDGASDSFESDGNIISAGIVVSEVDLDIFDFGLDLNLDLGASIFKSNADVERSSYDGDDEIDITGINFNVAKNFVTKVGDIYSVLGFTFADIDSDSIRNVAVNGSNQNASSSNGGKYYALSLSADHQRSLFKYDNEDKTTLNLSAISSLQNISYDSYQEQGLTAGNFSVDGYSNTSLNLELISSVQHSLDRVSFDFSAINGVKKVTNNIANVFAEFSNRIFNTDFNVGSQDLDSSNRRNITILPQDTVLEAGLSIYKSQNISDAEADASISGLSSSSALSSSSQRLVSDYSSGPVLGLLFGIKSPVAKDVNLKARYELRKSSKIDDSNMMIGVSWSF